MNSFTTRYRHCIIHEVTPSNIGRYVLPLVRKLKARDGELNCYIQIESFVDLTEVQRICEPEGIRVLKGSEINAFLKTLDVAETLFVTYSYRIPDLFWTRRYRLSGVKTAQIQHGMYMKYLTRDVTGFVSNALRKLVYLMRMIQLIASSSNRLSLGAFLLNKDFLNSDFIRKWLRGRSLSNIQSDHLFVWGEYWADWFTQYHYYPPDRPFTVIGNPDYFRHADLFKGEPELGVTYICQTLVEDGRMTRSAFEALLGVIASYLPDKRQVYLKLHPRSDRSLYADIIKKPNVSLTDTFPYTTHYLGHYSSMLVLGISEKSCLGLIHIEGHEIPNFLVELSVATSVEPVKLKSILSGEELVEENNMNIDYYFLRTEKDPDKAIIEQIIKN